MTITAATPTDFSALNLASKATQTANEAGSADRFLKLLVTQMQNQDPLNPMDNAQITSQMAQINTVSGIEKLNDSFEAMGAQFVQLQTLSGASLVGRDVTLNSNRMAMDGSTGTGRFVLGGTADKVKVEIVNGAGRVVATQELGAMKAGAQQFSWNASGQPAGTTYSFKVTATSGTSVVSSTALARDRVNAVFTEGTTLMLDTAAHGPVAWRDVKAFN
jgi:flagellar basal-body rod modification protein FlgD